ncbi:MAG: hypothetical protein ABSG67_17810 [Thermoguttaceae bacterium]|jgi:hypothetical protein
MRQNRTFISVITTALVVASVSSGLCDQPSDAKSLQPRTLGVGLRRSSYGLRGKNADDAWWIARAKAYAQQFPGAEPVIIEIVSGYQGDGSTEFGFAKPADYTGPSERMSFLPGTLDHHRALAAYDAAGVKAIIQFEPGDADVVRCIEIANKALGRHACVIGYGIDAEWYFTKQSPKKEGLPVPDEAAKAWVEKTLALNKDFNFFIKHFDAGHLPPKYRHPQLWFLDDSQQFADQAEFLADFKAWAKAVDGSTTGYQFGYPADRKWWSNLKQPPKELGSLLLKEIPACRWLFWVDFTADRVNFE